MQDLRMVTFIYRLGYWVFVTIFSLKGKKTPNTWVWGNKFALSNHKEQPTFLTSRVVQHFWSCMLVLREAKISNPCALGSFSQDIRVPSGCPCSKKGWVAVHLLLLYTPCKFSCEIWHTVLVTKFFKGRFLDLIEKRKLLHVELACEYYQEKIRQSPWCSFVGTEYIQLIACSLTARAIFSEGAVYSRNMHCFHK